MLERIVMPPLTMAILASVLQMQGADASITSDNKGIDDLLANIRGQLEGQINSSGARVIEAVYSKGGVYYKIYQKLFTKLIR
jgi:hypothetical protein